MGHHVDQQSSQPPSRHRPTTSPQGPAGEVAGLVLRLTSRGGGNFGMGSEDGEGGEVPYEINTTWCSALNRDNSREERAFQVKRIVASRSIALALAGAAGTGVRARNASEVASGNASRTRTTGPPGQARTSTVRATEVGSGIGSPAARSSSR